MKRILTLAFLVAVFILPQSVEARHHGRKPHVSAHHKHSHNQVAKAKAKAKTKHAIHKKRSARVR